MSDYSTVAYVLGVKDAASISPMDLARSVSAGLPTRALTLVADAVSPDDNAFRHKRVVAAFDRSRPTFGFVAFRTVFIIDAVFETLVLQPAVQIRTRLFIAQLMPRSINTPAITMQITACRTAFAVD